MVRALTEGSDIAWLGVVKGSHRARVSGWRVLQLAELPEKLKHLRQPWRQGH
jgi:hypothetical protein